MQPFKRTRVTWMAYFFMIFFGLGISLMGPIVPFIGERLGLTYGQMGLHFTLLAAGNFSTGLTGEWVAERIGNRRAAWGGVIVELLGIFGVFYGSAYWMTLTSAVFIGYGSGITALITTAMVADAHPDHQTKALTEGNIMAGTGVALNPLLIGLFEQSGLGWQAHVWLLLVVAVAVIAVFGGQAFPTPRNESEEAIASGRNNQPLPPLFWLFGAVLFMTIAIEWVIISWTPDFLATVVGLDRGLAATLGSAFAWAIVAGRIMGRWLVEIISPDVMLVGAFVLLATLTPIFVFAPIIALSIGVLFLLGLSTANQFPLGLDAAMAAGGDQTRRASARISIFGGLAALSMPQTVGSLADAVGIQLAFLLVPVLAVIAIAVTLYALRRRARLLMQPA